MLKVIVCGINGFMGKLVVRDLLAGGSAEVIAGVDLVESSDGDIPVYSDVFMCPGSADVLVDFSHPSALDANISFATMNDIPMVICATGYTEEQLGKIEEASHTLPIFFSANMSLGVNLMGQLCRETAAFFGDDADIEIIEKHHRRKLDAPSGTAKALAQEIINGLGHEAELIYGRAPGSGKRSPGEIGIHAIRGGTIVGEHSALFIRDHEIVEIKHIAESREIFSAGTVRAAFFIAGRPAGMYDMHDLINDHGAMEYVRDDSLAMVSVSMENCARLLLAVSNELIPMHFIANGTDGSVIFFIPRSSSAAVQSLINRIAPMGNFELDLDAVVFHASDVPNERIAAAYAEAVAGLSGLPVLYSCACGGSIVFCVNSAFAGNAEKLLASL